MARSENQLGSEEAIRKRIRDKFANGELQDGDHIDVKALVSDDELNWDSILGNLHGHQGSAVSGSSIPLHLLTWDKEKDDLIVTFLDADVVGIAHAISFNVQEGMKSGALRSGEHKVSSYVQNLDARRHTHLVRLLDRKTIARADGRPIDHLVWDPHSRTFAIHPIKSATTVAAS